MVPVSAVIITYNNVETLRETLDSLKWTQEIVVVDSGSTDGTIEIAQAAGCKIIYHTFDGYGTQKHFAVSQSEHDWVFVVDADEVCTTELITELLQAIDSGKHDAYEVPISLVFLGKILRFGGEYKKRHLRLFNKKKGQYNFNRVHEDVVMNEGSVGKLSNHMLHHSYRHLHQYFSKFNQYTTAAANDLFDAGKSSGYIWPVLKGLIAFLKLYIFRGLILDGSQGFIWAVFSSWYTSAKYIKLAEKCSKKRK